MLTNQAIKRHHKPKPTSSVAYANGKPARSLTKAELAVFVPCSERFLELEVQAGRLKCMRLGKRVVRFSPQAIAEWMDGAQSPPQPEMQLYKGPLMVPVETTRRRKEANEAGR
jgi:hypothetical protein